MTIPFIPKRALLLRRIFGKLQRLRGVPRLLWVLRTWAFPAGSVLVVSPDGLPITISRDDYGQVMLFYFPYCPELKALLRDVLQPHDVCMDLGANVGLISAFMVQHLSRLGKVLAVEPNPPTAAQLQSTVNVYFPEQVQVIRAGIASSVGSGFLARPENAFSESFEVSVESSMGESIQLTTIDRLVEEYCADHLPDFIKVDIEGYEVHLIQSMQGIFARGHKPVLLVEFHTEKCRKHNVSVDQIRRQLVGLGYEERCVVANGDDYCLSVPLSTFEHENILFATPAHFPSRPALAAKWEENDGNITGKS